MSFENPDKKGWIKLEKSTNLAGIRYNAADQTLTVQFAMGAQYMYLDVPEEVVTELLEATSKGQYLNKVIKGSYDFVKVEQEEDDGCDA